MDFGSRVRSNFQSLKSTSIASAVVSGKESPVKRRSKSSAIPRFALVQFEGLAHKYPIQIVSFDQLRDSVIRIMKLVEKWPNETAVESLSIRPYPQANRSVSNLEELSEFASVPGSEDLGGIVVVTAIILGPSARPSIRTVSEAQKKMVTTSADVAPTKSAVETKSVVEPPRCVASKPLTADASDQTDIPIRVQAAEPSSGREHAVEVARKDVSGSLPDNSDGLIGKDSFEVPNASNKTIAEIRLIAIDRYCLRNATFSRDSLEITLREAKSGRPLLLSRDVRRAAETMPNGSVAVDAFVYATSPSAEARPILPSPAALSRDPQARQLNFDDCSNKSTGNHPSVVSQSVSHSDHPQQRETDRSTRISRSPSRQRRVATVTIPIRHGDDQAVVEIPVSLHPPLEDLVKNSIAIFLGDDDSERLKRRAVLTYFRNAVGLQDARHVTMSSDAHVAGLIWEVLERERTGDTAESVCLTLHV